MNKHYTARATRSGKWWAITVDGLRGAHSQAKRLDQVENNAREVISLLTDSDPDSFTVEVVQEMPAEWSKIIAEFMALSNQATEMAMRVTQAQRFTVGRLVQEGLTVRDVGELMHLSHQRVAQIAQLLEDTDQVRDEIGEFGGGLWGLPAAPLSHVAHDAPNPAGQPIQAPGTPERASAS
ncbi:MAG TPA: hypothetical protein VMU76_11285 [Acidimicrobiales bacterium]|nr:hypothetical protein [Acidimicrobiales bacterium]